MAMGNDVQKSVTLILVVTAILMLHQLGSVGATRCGPRLPCANKNLCCSPSGYCGTSDYDCGDGCQSGACYQSVMSGLGTAGVAAPQSTSKTVAHVLSAEMFDEISPNRNPFFSYPAFLTAASAFPDFGRTGSLTARKREIAAFFAHVHLASAGMTRIEGTEQTSVYCDAAAASFHCAAGKKYFARGPLALTWNYNYGRVSQLVDADILGEPELVSKDAVISFKSALSVWMTASENKPSSHAVMTGLWTPTHTDIAAGRLPGFGTTINIMNGRKECGHVTPEAETRVKLYSEFAKLLNVSPGNGIECAAMIPF